jgi:hypothetical protein
MRSNSTVRRIYLAPVLGLAFISAISACSSSSSSSSSTAASSSASTSAAATASSSPAASATGSAVSQITTNWNKFFSTSTSNSEREQLLENGSQFSAALSAFTSSPLASAVTSKVDSVTVTSPTEATVKYDLSALGATVAKGATGTAVLQDGTWKVGDNVFCGLLSQAKAAGLSIPVPSACSSAS